MGAFSHPFPTVGRGLQDASNASKHMAHSCRIILAGFSLRSLFNYVCAIFRPDSRKKQKMSHKEETQNLKMNRKSTLHETRTRKPKNLSKQKKSLDFEEQPSWGETAQDNGDAVYLNKAQVETTGHWVRRTGGTRAGSDLKQDIGSSTISK